MASTGRADRVVPARSGHNGIKLNTERRHNTFRLVQDHSICQCDGFAVYCWSLVPACSIVSQDKNSGQVERGRFMFEPKERFTGDQSEIDYSGNLLGFE